MYRAAIISNLTGDHDGDALTAPRAFYAGYDGRGNVTTLVESGQGRMAAGFEYAPFGERVRAETTADLPSITSLGAHFGFARGLIGTAVNAVALVAIGVGRVLEVVGNAFNALGLEIFGSDYLPVPFHLPFHLKMLNEYLENGR